MLNNAQISPLELESDLQFENWGLIEYKIALSRMQNYAKQISENNETGRLIFCSHPPVVTLGRATQANDVFAWDGAIENISRGGRATYHGPSQLVIYPMVNLKFERRGRKAQEVVGYLRAVEECVVAVLRSYKVNAVGRSLQKRLSLDHAAEETGVWVDDKKIASLGVAVKNWVTIHGAAINLDEDPTAFQGIRPCGFESSVMVSLEKLCGQKINRQEFSEVMKQNLLRKL